MDVILHVGAHRTATTTLQRYMACHRDTLSESGVVFWGPKVTRGGLFRGAIDSADGMLNWQVLRVANRSALRAEAVRQSGASHLVISDENMLGSLRGVLEDTRLYGDAGRRVACYARGFSRHRVTIALCVRDYSEWWTSALAFSLLRGGPLPRAALRERMVTQPRRWRFIIEDIARAVPDASLVVWSHEALASAPHRVVKDLTGATTPPSPEPIRNKRPAAEELLEFLRSCEISPAHFDWPDGQFKPFQDHELEALNAQYQEDLAWLSAGAGGFADYIDSPSAQIDAQTALGRGLPDDGENRELA